MHDARVKNFAMHDAQSSKITMHGARNTGVHFCVLNSKLSMTCIPNVMCFFLPRDMGGILILRKMRKNEKV